jgi:TolA-binding protein
VVDQAKSWIKDNSTLVTFLVAQLLAMGAGAAWVIAYSVKLETRVAIMETRGAEYTVARMNKIDERLTVLEQQIRKNADSIERVISLYLKDLQQKQAPR